MSFSNTLLQWYAQNKRELPWRGTKNPYLIWISEVILQQTRIAQGTAYFHRFIEAFPTVESLAQAPEDRVMRLWQGLGYYSRARNLQFAAKQIVNEMGGKFPETYTQLLRLKGVGKYIAAAIASIAYNEPQAVVDGNVYRVLSRYFGIATPIDTTKGQNEFLHLANELINKQLAGEHNQAVMEFGALHCTPQNPHCEACVLRTHCEARRTNTVEALPVKSKKTEQKTRYFNYLVIKESDFILIQKREKKDIWQGLYEFPLIETELEVELNELIENEQWKSIFLNSDAAIAQISQKYKHILSHQIIFAKFYIVEVPFLEEINSEKNCKIPLNSVVEYAMPRLINRFLNDSQI